MKHSQFRLALSRMKQLVRSGIYDIIRIRVEHIWYRQIIAEP